MLGVTETGLLAPLAKRGKCDVTGREGALVEECSDPLKMKKVSAMSSQQRAEPMWIK